MRYFNITNKTEPILVHFQGHSKQKLSINGFGDSLINTYDKQIIKPNDLTIITFAFGKDVESFPLLKQLKLHKVHYINICDLYEITRWGNKLKVSLLYDFLKENKKSLTKYVTVLDASDIVLSENFARISEDIKQSKFKIIYGGDRSKYPTIKIGDESYTNVPYKTRYLNGGNVVAETEYYIEFIKECMKHLEDKENVWESEQYIIRKALTTFKYREIIDHDPKCEIFQTMNYGSFKIKDKYLMIE